MNKQFTLYVCNRIIFTVLIWLMIFVPSVNAGEVSSYGIHETNGGWARWVNSTHNAMVSVSYTANAFHEHNTPHTISNWVIHNTNTFTNVGSCTATYYSEICTIVATGTSPDIVYHNVFIEPQLSYAVGYWYLQEQKAVYHFYPVDVDTYTLSGSTCAIDSVSLYINDALIEYKDTNLSVDTYEFDIVNNTNYKIEFSDTHTYEFTCTGDEVYNRDLCGYQILYYVDDCANFLKNPLIDIIKNDNYADPLIYQGTSNTDVFIIGTDVQLNDKLDIYIDTDQGTQFRRVYVELGEDTLYHGYKSWNLNIKVYDVNTSGYVGGAKVSVSQDCRINDYQHNTYGATNVYGLVKTFDLSNQNYKVKVEKENYNTFGWSTISPNFDAQQTDYPLRINIQNSSLGGGNGSIGDPDGDGDGTGGDDDEPLPQTLCSIGWFSNDQKPISEINDTQDARLYFMASNCSTELFIDSRDVGNHVWVTESALPLTPKQTGYVQLTSANWTYPETKRYRGRLYSYDCGCDVTDDLKVWDALDPNTTSITNLSSYVWFRHTIGSYVNPSSPIVIKSSAESNNTTLLNINLKLFNESVKVDEISYTFFDYYVNSKFTSINWEPNYEYSKGYNYSIYMYSNDILVDFDTVSTHIDDDSPFDTGHALTVKVYDQSAYPIQYSTVYVESWGALDTGSVSEITFSGLGDDDYNYKVIKSGYLDRGYFVVTMTTDKTVSYILDIISSEHVVKDIRMSNSSIRDMLYPIVFFILIMLLVGVLIDAVN